ncbi:MAG TPA: flavin-dependent oxidoreductase [Beijerinckiaceae bacterium]|jgi:2-polyprenyl-6-methoxyphenol hydroxylase-like FAD-dependent oxidoreductase|nr:flavin-dependent oxidoreductase [Beijerinckiaceae bacterium]
MDEVLIVGAGICGLTLALNLHKRGMSCRVFERAPEMKELGVGITLLPHGMREFTALGLQEKLLAAGIENSESRFYNRFGQLIYREPRGKAAGYEFPEVGIHRGRLQMILYESACARLGAERIELNRTCVGIEQDEQSARVLLQETLNGQMLASAEGLIAIACDGVNSIIRKKFYPGDDVVFTGINTWRGVTRRKPILDGRTYFRIGSILTGKIVIYPIVDDIDGGGNQLINWTTEIKRDAPRKNDWNRPGELADFYPVYERWTFDWLDVAQLIRESEIILEYPMVDKDPIARWTFGRVTFAGDAAHPMYPRGSNGSAQAVIDARVLADALQQAADPRDALRAYEAERLPATARVVRTNREFPPDFINIKVEELVGDRPFDNLDDYITQDELRALSDEYKKTAGFALAGAR